MVTRVVVELALSGLALSGVFGEGKKLGVVFVTGRHGTTRTIAL
jgi:hypothetical protein